jgi:hypothetical protein
MKRMTKNLKAECLRRAAASFKNFLCENRRALTAAFCFTLVCYGFMLTHYTLTIDEETWICNTDPALIQKIWMLQGRFGLYLFDAVFTPLGRYVPFLWDFLGIVFWFAGGVVFCFCLTRYVSAVSRLSVGVFAAMFTTVPLAVGELLSYSMFSLQQGLAMLLVSASAALTFFWFRTRRGMAAAGAALLLFAGVSFYQAFATVYITAMAAYVCLSLIYGSGGRFWRSLVGSVGIFAAGVGAYFLINAYITRVLYPGADAYLENNFIGWDGGNPLVPLLPAVKNTARVLLGREVYGGKALLLLTVLTALAFCIRLVLLIRERNGRAAAGLIVGFAALLLAPFSMLFGFAQPTLIGRTLLALPLSMSVQAVLVVDTARLLPKPSASRWIAGGLLLCVLLINAAYMNNLFYNSYRVYTEDQAKAAQIMSRIAGEGMDASKKPVVFIGMLPQNAYLSADCSAGGSFFAWDNGNIARMRDFLNAEGYTILPADADQIQRGALLAEEMPCWPAEGCAADAGDFILIKFSDPAYPWEIVNGAAVS